MSDNPRLQCEKCGKWRRLCDRHGNQLMFPVEPAQGDPRTGEDYWDCLCVWCHKELYGIILPPLT